MGSPPPLSWLLTRPPPKAGGLGSWGVTGPPVPGPRSGAQGLQHPKLRGWAGPGRGRAGRRERQAPGQRLLWGDVLGGRGEKRTDTARRGCNAGRPGCHRSGGTAWAGIPGDCGGHSHGYAGHPRTSRSRCTGGRRPGRAAAAAVATAGSGPPSLRPAPPPARGPHPCARRSRTPGGAHCSLRPLG